MFFKKLRQEIRNGFSKLVAKQRALENEQKRTLAEIKRLKSGSKTSAESSQPPNSNQYGQAYDDQLRSLLDACITAETRTIVEYGSGASTRMMCDIIETKLTDEGRAGLVLLSIDHTENWQRAVALTLPWKRYLHLRHCELQGRCKSTEDKGVSYTTAPEQLRRPLDFVYVDGRNRAQCVLFTSLLLAPGGVIVLDDCKRERYQYLRHFFHESRVEGRFAIFKSPKVTRQEEAAPKTERRVIVQVAFGPKSKRELAIGGPSIEAYARRIGADYKVLDESDMAGGQPPPVEFAKFQCLDLIRQYDRAMALDTDTVMREGAPDVFQIVPADHLGVVFESEHMDRKGMIEVMRESFDLSQTQDKGRYFNSGVMVLGRSAYDLFETGLQETMFRHPNYEQTFLNARALKMGLPLYPLEKEFNYIASFDSPHSPDWRHAWLVHLAGSWTMSAAQEHEFWKQSAKQGDVVSFERQRLVGTQGRMMLMESLVKSMECEREIRALSPANFKHADKRRIVYRDPSCGVLTQMGGDAGKIPLLQGCSLELTPGRYRAKLNVVAAQDVDWRLRVEIFVDGSAESLAADRLGASDELAFEVLPKHSRLEFRVFGTKTPEVYFRGLLVERTDS